MLGLMKVEAYPDGAPSEACGNLFPKHDAKSQEGDPPYSVDLSVFTGNTYTPGQVYKSKEALGHFDCDHYYIYI